MTPARGRERDVRTGGNWTRAQRFKNDLIFLVVRSALALVVPLPRAFLRTIGRAVGQLLFLVRPGTRRTACATLERALPELPPRAAARAVAQAYLALGGHLGDALASLDSRRSLVPLAVDQETLDLLARAGQGSGSERRGVLFASAHLGPWERVAATLVAHGVPMTVLARETYDPRLGSIYDRLRAGRGVPAIYRGHPGAPIRIARTLRGGGVLAVPMDLRSRVPSVEVLFLGQKARVPVGPARIALRMGAAVVVGTVAPDHTGGEGLRITCTEIFTGDLTPGEAGERELTARLATELSNRIRALPGQWVWMHDRFAESPARAKMVSGAACDTDSVAPQDRHHERRAETSLASE